MDFKEFLKQEIGIDVGDWAAFKEDEVKRTEVGKITPHLQKEFMDMHDKLDEMNDDKKDRVKELALAAKRTVREEFSTREREIELLHKRLWQKTTDQLNLDPTKNYTVNVKTGAITLKHDSDE